jgi:hypothetical protein
LKDEIKLGTGDSHLLILATQEAEVRRIKVRSQPKESSSGPCLEKPITKKGLAEGSSSKNTCLASIKP